MSSMPAAPTKSASEDIKKIEAVIEIIYEDLLAEGGRYKVSELLKAIELKRKLAPTDDREKQFWNMIDGIRHKALAQKNKKTIGASGKSARMKGPHETHQTNQ